MDYSYNRLGTFGALGNQLWEFASTLGIALKNNGKAHFPSWEYQPLFSAPSHFFDNVPGEIDFSGDYLQDLSHFAGFEDVVKECFKPSQAAKEAIVNQLAAIGQFPHWTAVHVRRANNVHLPMHHPICEMSYFEEALDKLDKKTHIVVFSDDIEWCKKQSLFKDKAWFSEGNDPSIDKMLLTNGTPLSLPTVAYDLFIMTHAHAHIISNSTFSWWGAWLANRQGPVFYPKPWYGRALQHIDVEDTMIPKDGRWFGIEREIP